MENIIDNLFVGGDGDYDKHKNDKSFSFLRCCKFGPGGHKDILGYTTQAAPSGKNHFWVRKSNLMALNLLDLDDPFFVPDEAIQKGLDFIEERLKAGDKVLVACNQGHSRGPTTALLYLRSIGEMPYHFVSAERVYKTLYPPFDPAQGMRQYARMHW